MNDVASARVTKADVVARRPSAKITTKASNALRWRMMARVAVRMMLHDKLKMLGTLAGVVFAVLLATQQAGTFLGLLYKNVMLVDNSGADIWIIPPSTYQFIGGTKPIPESTLMYASVTPGVAWAQPLVYGAGSVTLPDGGSEGVTIVGTKAPVYAGGPWNLVVGDVHALERPNTMIFEHGERNKLGGLNLGSVREVNGTRVQAGGFTWGLLPFGASFSFAEYELARRLVGLAPGEVSFVLVGVEPGEDPKQVRARLAERLPDVEVHTNAEYDRLIVENLLVRTPIGLTFGTSAMFGLLIGFVIVALAMFSSVIDNIREFGTLKAIGATTKDLAKLLAVQAVSYAVLGSLIGLALVTRVAEAIRSPRLAILIPRELMLIMMVLMCLMCVMASGLALLRVRKVEPGMVFR